MVRLIALGRLDLTRPDGTRVDSVLQQPKRLALLAYLVIEGRAAHVRRDSLLAVFWPDADESAARHRLNQAVHALRRSLGAGSLGDKGRTHMIVDPGAVSCDAGDFEDACRAGRLREALDLYRGDLLPGFHLDGSNEFETWLEAQRARLRRMALEAARGLARRAGDGGDPTEAGRWARVMVDLAGADDAMVREALRILAEAGDRAGVAEVYSGFALRLAEDLDLEPDPETDAMARALLDPRAEPPAVARPAAAGAPVPPARTRRGRTVARVAGVAGVAALAILVAVWGVVPAPREPRTDALAGPALVVRSLDALEDDATGRDIARLLSPLVRDHLGAPTGLTVFASVPAAPESAPRRSAAGSAARFAVSGIVLSVEDGVRIQLELSDARTGQILWNGSVTRAPADVVALDDLASEIGWLVRSELGLELRARARGSSVAPADATALVARASEIRRTASEMRASGRLAVAVAGYQEADSLLAMAERAAPRWVEPITERAGVVADLAWVALLPPARDTARARAGFERAFELATRAVRHSPSDPAALELRATVAHRLVDIVAVEPARAERLLGLAHDDLRRAIAIDDQRPAAWARLSELAYRRADFAGAYLIARRAFDLDTYVEHGHPLLLRLFAAAHETGADAEAASWCEVIRRRYPDQLTGTYCALALIAWGERQDARSVAAAWRLVETLREESTQPDLVPRFEMMVASVLAGAALADSALGLIASARSRGAGDPELLHFEAHARLRLGQPEAAAALLDEYIAGDPLRRAYLGSSRRFQPLAASSPGRPGVTGSASPR